MIIENTSPKDLSKITELVAKCKEKGYDDDQVAVIIKKMVDEKILDSLNDRYVIRLEDSD